MPTKFIDEFTRRVSLEIDGQDFTHLIKPGSFRIHIPMRDGPREPYDLDLTATEVKEPAPALPSPNQIATPDKDGAA
jgi:hypothetical protein